MQVNIYEEFQSISDPNSINAEYISEPLSKKQKIICHQTTELEKNLLIPLMIPNSPIEEEIEEVLKLLLQVWDGWTKRKVSDYWSHHKPKLQ